ncbi:unnamed protein product [Kuraishia capsulata CBS 1993]|uniref:Proline dehydrogenase n=1 Tax=Kuraishia capsulata CBS 1993 TaxID=1382522 RepID=W6MH62_9ASCO|nr:uncharacterized protein KUCA_T00001253001 [Kuraishia capsulata CBS 1993]CDK25286.1 unnamed protein product [Kuraishia capsulata CBS 1993]
MLSTRSMYRSTAFLRVGLVLNRRTLISSKTTKTVMPVTYDSTPEPSNREKSPGYLEALTTPELLSYGLIGLATLNKGTLDMAIKAFPFIPTWMLKVFLYKNYCGGEDFEQVKATGARLAKRGIKNMMISLTIEAAEVHGDAEPIDIGYIVRETKKSVSEVLVPHTLSMISESGDLNSVPPGYVALKPTGLIDDAVNVLTNYEHPDYSVKFEELVANCSEICEIVRTANARLAKEHPERIAPFVVATIDAEKFTLQRGVYELQRRLFARFNVSEEPISVVGTIQMYLKESQDLLASEYKLAQQNRYRVGWKLVRGAYIHTEPDRSVIHDTKENTDDNYNRGISRTIDQIVKQEKNTGVVGHLVVASHNYDSQLFAEEIIKSSAQKSNITLAQLLGMADDVTHDLIHAHGVNNIIKYVPWGPPKETKDYLLRRLEENGDAVRSDSGWPLLKGIVSVIGRRWFTQKQSL